AVGATGATGTATISAQLVYNSASGSNLSIFPYFPGTPVTALCAAGSRPTGCGGTCTVSDVEGVALISRLNVNNVANPTGCTLVGVSAATGPTDLTSAVVAICAP